MVEPGPVSVAVLAAGHSRRFGMQDKLAAKFRGEMLGVQVCRTLSTLSFAHRWVITASHAHACRPAWQRAGFTLAVNNNAESGMGTSVAKAAELASSVNARRLLICLADMPLVTQTHFRALIAQSDGADALSVTATRAGQNGQPMPPAIFGYALLPQLARISGDIGARAMLRRAAWVAAPPETLIDIDTPAALNRANRVAD